MPPLITYILPVVGSILFLYGSVWNIIHHVEPNKIFYVYAAGSLCFLAASTINLIRRIKMENQHKHIKGYRDLSEEEIALMNEAKELAEQVGQLVSKVEGIDGIDKRWVAIGKTDLQKGFMSLIRSIAQPTTF